MSGAEAREMLGDLDSLRVTRGKKVLSFDLRDVAERPADDEILSLILGRSGTLRAPAFRIGATLYVGYNPNLLALIP